MVVEALFNGLFAIVNVIVSLIPSFDFTIPTGVMDGIVGFVGGVGYVLPIAGLLPILLISVGISASKIIVALVIRIKSFIPTMGA